MDQIGVEPCLLYSLASFGYQLNNRVSVHFTRRWKDSVKVTARRTLTTLRRSDIPVDIKFISLVVTIGRMCVFVLLDGKNQDKVSSDRGHRHHWCAI